VLPPLELVDTLSLEPDVLSDPAVIPSVVLGPEEVDVWLPDPVVDVVVDPIVEPVVDSASPTYPNQVTFLHTFPYYVRKLCHRMKKNTDIWLYY
jgi:hypothetical protein